MNAREANGPPARGYCDRCRHWNGLGDEHGECRRNPPAVAAVHVDMLSTWPITNADEWCGEWAPIAVLVLDDGEASA